MLVRHLEYTSSVREFELSCVLNPNLFFAYIAIEGEVCCARVPYLIKVIFIINGHRLHYQLDCEGWTEGFRVPLLAVPQGELKDIFSISLQCLKLVASARHPGSFSRFNSTDFNDH